MSNYEDIYGKRVKELSADPTLNSSYEGQVWYNSTEGVLKSLVNFDSWSSTAPMGSGRYAIAKGTLGTQTAALAALGRKGGPSQNSTEEYNGTGWNTEGNANTARYGLGGFGTTSAFVAAGGAPAQNTVEEYNGSSWTTVTSLPGTARTYLSGFGTESAGAAFGGGTGSPDTVVTTTNEYDGSSWTSGGALNTGGSGCAATGTQTAATTATRTVLPFNTASGAAEQYDGSSWTTITSVNTSRYSAVGFGTKDDMTICGGVPNSTATEKWNGSSWTTSPATLATGRNRFGGAGATSGSGLAFAGNPPGVGTTEEFNNSTNVFTGDGFISGADLPSPLGPANKYTVIAAFGNTPALTTAGGAPGASANAASLNYNGTSWSANPDTNDGAAGRGGAGTQTAGVAFGGVSTFSRVAKTEEWDGSSWTTSGDLNTSRDLMSSAGTQTAALAAGGYTGLVGSLATEEYNGSSWTSGNNINYGSPGVINGSGGGTQTAGWIAGGFSSPASPVTTFSNHSRYDGTNWTSSTALSTALCDHSSGGTQTAGIVMGGRDDATSGPTYFSSAFTFDGSAWRTTGSLATARREANRGFCNSSPSSLIAGGYTGSESRATEEFAAGTETLGSASTLTSS